MDGRKPKTPSDISVKAAANGGFIVRHAFDNMGSGESYQPPKEHAFTSHGQMMTHLRTHTRAMAGMADEAEAADNAKEEKAEAKRPAGVGHAPAKGHAPGPKTRGAGLD